MLYAVFLTSIAVSGVVLTLGFVKSRGPAALSAIPAVVALLAIAVCLALAHACRGELWPTTDGDSQRPEDSSRVRSGGRLIGLAVRDACRLVRLGDSRLAGAIAYWGFDAGVLWAMLQAFGSPPVLPVLALAYLVGQVANTLPIPGSVSGGIAGVLIAFGVPVNDHEKSPLPIMEIPHPGMAGSSAGSVRMKALNGGGVGVELASVEARSFRGSPRTGNVLMIA